jgi:hypothetical protein
MEVRNIFRFLNKIFKKYFDTEKVKKANFVTATDYDTFKAAYAKDYKFRICGFGATDNKGTRSKKLLCGEMLVSSAAECKTVLPDANFPEDGTAVCLTSNSDTNVCAGDYGGNFFVFFLNFNFLLNCLN